MCNALLGTHAGSRECVMLTLNFSSALPGTVLDKDGQGTGFTYVQPNTTGNQYDAASTLSQRLAPSYLQALWNQYDR